MVSLLLRGLSVLTIRLTKTLVFPAPIRKKDGVDKCTRFLVTPLAYEFLLVSTLIPEIWWVPPLFPSTMCIISAGRVVLVSMWEIRECGKEFAGA